MSNTLRNISAASFVCLRKGHERIWRWQSKSKNDAAAGGSGVCSSGTVPNWKICLHRCRPLLKNPRKSLIVMRLDVSWLFHPEKVILLMKASFRRTVVPVFVVSMAFSALQGVTQTAIDSVVYKIPENVIKEIRRDPERAIQTLMTFAFSCNDDGIVTEKCYTTVRSIEKAQMRVRQAEFLLFMDLNADGTVTLAELKACNRTQEPRRQSKNTLAFLEADTNEDDILTITEVMQYADTRIAKQGRAISGRALTG
jgi:hypothetical protein